MQPAAVRILVTGAAGFIGFHVAGALMRRGDEVTGFDNVNDYYDLALKEARLAELDRIAAATGAGWRFRRADLADGGAVAAAFAEAPFDRVIHLAAQAGVRYSLENPMAYVELEPRRASPTSSRPAGTRGVGAPHLRLDLERLRRQHGDALHARAQGVDHPLQFYAATKRANELMAHAYAHLYRLPCTGLRFFTVYGPWGRPDMAPMLFASAILEGRPIRLFNHGRHSRDFTYRRRHRRGR